MMRVRWRLDRPTWAELRTFAAAGHAYDATDRIEVDQDDDGVMVLEFEIAPVAD